LYAVTADAATLKGKVYPDEHKVLKAEESGFKVLQLTTNPADDNGTGGGLEGGDEERVVGAA
jgi:hypothetical protein